MDTIEAFLSGENTDEWLHLADDIDNAPQYLIQHEENLQRIEEYKEKYNDNY
jgi:protoporphyrinogen oxidase